MLAALLLALAAAPLHDESVSASFIEIDGAVVTHRLHFQGLSLIEVLPAVDGDGDGTVTQAELDASADDVGFYLLRRYRFFHDAGEEVGSGTPLAGELLRLEAVDQERLGDFQMLRATLRWTAEAPLEDLATEVFVFHDQSKTHVDEAFFVWNERYEVPHYFFYTEPRRWIAPDEIPPVPTLRDWAGDGAGAAVEAWWVAGFLLALGLGATSAGGFVLALAVALLARACGLAVAETAVYDPSAHRHLLELVALLALAYAAGNDLVYRGARALWIEAAGFGFAHGLTASLAYRASLGDEPDSAFALGGFALGHEGALALAALAALLALRLAPGARTVGETRWLAPTWLRRPGAALLCPLGLAAFVGAAWGVGPFA